LFLSHNYAREEEIRTLSYRRGPDRPLLELTLGALLERTASRLSRSLAVASRHRKAPHMGRAERPADSVARGLWSLGIRKGDRVGLWSTNCIEWVMITWAAHAPEWHWST